MAEDKKEEKPKASEEATAKKEAPKATKKKEVKSEEKATKAKSTDKEDKKATSSQKANKEKTETKEAKPAAKVAEKAPEKKAEEKSKKAKPVSTAKKTSEIKPLDDFDWTSIDQKEDDYSADERKKMEEQYDDTLNSIEQHQVINGSVVSKSKKEVVVNINYKSEGVVSASEFRYNPDLAVGDNVEVYVETREDKNGQLILSHAKARTMQAWDKINDSFANGTIVTGYVKCRTKGGLIVDVFGIEAFLPGSQIDVKPIRDYDIYVGKNMEFKVVKVNHEFKNVVVSHKALIEAELEEQKSQIMKQLEKGQVLEGTVKNITSYGVFIDLGGVDGLIHITDLSWGRINHPEEIVDLDQTLKVVILDFDENKNRIALGLKQLSDHPWDKLDEKLTVGDKVKGKVVVLADYGAFVEIAPGVEGLIHVSEMSWAQHLRSAQDFFNVGDEVEATVMTLDREDRKMSLSTRQLTTDPWEGIESRYPVDSKHKGKVTNISHFGVFVEMEEGVDGLIHISDLSWSKKINHPNEFTSVGEELEVVVLEIDQENRRMSLGHKQLEENPWEVFETVFTMDSTHKGTIQSVNDKGGIVVLPYGVEGFVPGKHMQKADGNKAVADEELEFKVIEFKKESKKIILSHTLTHKDSAGVSDEKKGGGKKRKSDGGSRSAMNRVSKNLEKTTLGDLDVLADLKGEMEEQEGKDKPKAKKETKAKATKKKAAKSKDADEPDDDKKKSDK